MATLPPLDLALPVTTRSEAVRSSSRQAVFSLLMMENGFLATTLNLGQISDDAKGPRHLREVELKKARRVMSNNFAFGVINTSLIIAAPS